MIDEKGVNVAYALFRGSAFLDSEFGSTRDSERIIYLSLFYDKLSPIFWTLYCVPLKIKTLNAIVSKLGYFCSYALLPYHVSTLNYTRRGKSKERNSPHNPHIKFAFLSILRAEMNVFVCTFRRIWSKRSMIRPEFSIDDLSSFDRVTHTGTHPNQFDEVAKGVFLKRFPLFKMAHYGLVQALPSQKRKKSFRKGEIVSVSKRKIRLKC